MQGFGRYSEEFNLQKEMIESIIFRTDAKTLSTMVCVSSCGIMANE